MNKKDLINLINEFADTEKDLPAGWQRRLDNKSKVSLFFLEK